MANVSFKKLITFTRSTGGGRFNASGQYEWLAADKPRFDFDPVTLEPRGILIEEQRTNLLTYSEQFDNAAWSKVKSSVVPNAAVAPDGTLTAEKYIAAGGVIVGNAQLFNQQTVTASTAYSLSTYAKAGEVSKLRVSFICRDAANAYLGEVTYLYDLGIGTVTLSNATSNGPTVYSAAITPAGNGWYRCILTAVTTSSTGKLNGSLRNVDAGNGTSGIYIWGAQLEAGAFPTSYIPTTTAQVTRAGDVCSVSNLSPWYRADEFTALVEFTRGASFVQSGGGPLSPRIVSFGTNYEGIMQLRAFSSANLEWVGSSVSGVGMYADAGTWSSSAASNKVGVAYKSMSTAAISVNGGTAGLDSTVPAYLGVSLMAIGRNTTSDNIAPLNGHIRRIRYIPRRVSDTELQALTAI